jgi:hypothetical protein
MEGNSRADQKRRSFRDRSMVAASFCPTESEKFNPRSWLARLAQSSQISKMVLPTAQS